VAGCGQSCTTMDVCLFYCINQGLFPTGCTSGCCVCG
jgi:hypothetical protein